MTSTSPTDPVSKAIVPTSFPTFFLRKYSTVSQNIFLCRERVRILMETKEKGENTTKNGNVIVLWYS